MARKLLNLCLVSVLLWGCAGGLLAAAFCPHAGCRATAEARPADASHAEHTAGRDHGSASPEDHTGHGAGHDAGPSSQTQHQAEAGAPSFTASDSHDSSCAHCVGRAEAPPSRCFEWRSNWSAKNLKEFARREARQAAPPPSGFVREIRPAQHAPPGDSDRHVLLNVFRI